MYEKSFLKWRAISGTSVRPFPEMRGVCVISNQQTRKVDLKRMAKPHCWLAVSPQMNQYSSEYHLQWSTYNAQSTQEVCYMTIAIPMAKDGATDEEEYTLVVNHCNIINRDSDRRHRDRHPHLE